MRVSVDKLYENITFQRISVMPVTFRIGNADFLTTCVLNDITNETTETSKNHEENLPVAHRLRAGHARCHGASASLRGRHCFVIVIAREY